MPNLLRLASLAGKLKITVLNSKVGVVLVSPFDAPSGIFDPEQTPPTVNDIGLRTVNNNHILSPDNAARNEITIRAIDGDIRYGYTDDPDLHQNGFLVSEGDSKTINSPLPIYVSNPTAGSGNIEVDFDEGQG